MEFNVTRLCRLDGQRPTSREKWAAFWRLWRIVRNQTSAQLAEEAALCFRVLMPSWRFIRLAQEGGDFYASLRFMPLEMRWQWVNKRKLLREIFDDAEATQGEGANP